MKKSKIMDLTFKFSLSSIELFKKLQEDKEFVLSRQFLKSATSIGANVFEASAASSRKDFVNKMTIASKEARESYYWLCLLNESQLIKQSLESNLSENKSIINVLTSIIKTTKESMDKQ